MSDDRASAGPSASARAAIASSSSDTRSAVRRRGARRPTRRRARPAARRGTAPAPRRACRPRSAPRRPPRRSRPPARPRGRPARGWRSARSPSSSPSALPQRPQPVAQARPGARVEHLGPETRRQLAARVVAGVQREPRQQRARAPRAGQLDRAAGGSPRRARRARGCAAWGNRTRPVQSHAPFTRAVTVAVTVAHKLLATDPPDEETNTMSTLRTRITSAHALAFVAIFISLTGRGLRGRERDEELGHLEVGEGRLAARQGHRATTRSPGRTSPSDP